MITYFAFGTSTTELEILSWHNSHSNNLLTFMGLSSALPITKQQLKPLLGVHGRRVSSLQVEAQGTNASNFGTVKQVSC